MKSQIAKARRREIAKSGQMFFPIRLVDFEKLQQWELFDADAGKDSAKEIRKYFIPDFSSWKDHDSYQAAVGRLLTELKQEQAVDTARDDK